MGLTKPEDQVFTLGLMKRAPDKVDRLIEAPAGGAISSTPEPTTKLMKASTRPSSGDSWAEAPRDEVSLTC